MHQSKKIIKDTVLFADLKYLSCWKVCHPTVHTSSGLGALEWHADHFLPFFLHTLVKLSKTKLHRDDRIFYIMNTLTHRDASDILFSLTFKKITKTSSNEVSTTWTKLWWICLWLVGNRFSIWMQNFCLSCTFLHSYGI